MNKRAICAAICLSLCVSLGGQAFAAENGEPADIQCSSAVTVQDVALSIETDVTLDYGVLYVSYWPIVRALYPDAQAVWVDNHALVTATGLEMKIWLDRCYLEVNGRYLYIDHDIRDLNGNILVSIDVLSKALGAPLQWIPELLSVRITGPAVPLESGETFYQEDDLYWLSHIISAESGNQPITGKIAVGNVVLNRVADPRFPNNIHDVIFQRNQFTPASSGSIHRTPTEESVLAAKLCLDGANTVGSSLYFVNPRIAPRSWASRNRAHVATIGAHAFFA